MPLSHIRTRHGNRGLPGHNRDLEADSTNSTTKTRPTDPGPMEEATRLIRHHVMECRKILYANAQQRTEFPCQPHVYRNHRRIHSTEDVGRNGEALNTTGNVFSTTEGNLSQRLDKACL